MLDHDIVNAIKADYTAFKREATSIRKMRRFKVDLFRKYLDYPEEFIAYLDSMSGCYISNVDCRCPGPQMGCDKCTKDYIYPYYINQLNKYPSTKGDESIESSNCG